MIVLTTEQLVYQLKLRRGDTRGDAFTDKICLALINWAAEIILNEFPVEKVGAIGGLFDEENALVLSGGSASIADDVLKVLHVRQKDSPCRTADIVSIEEYKRRSTRSMLAGTMYRPLAGIVLPGKTTTGLLYLDAGGYSGDVYYDYVRRPVELKMDGVEDMSGSTHSDADVEPEWPSQISIPILEKAVELGDMVENRIGKESGGEQLLAAILQRIAA